MIPPPNFITSGPHLSGYRVCLGYNTLTEAQDAHAALAASKTPETPVGEGDELDLYDDKVQAGISWAMRQWGEALGLTTWTQGDGSESVEGDVGAEIHTILIDAGLRDPETNEMATLAAQPSAGGQGEAVAWRAIMGSDPDRQHWTLCSADPTGEPGWHSIQPLYTAQPDSGVVEALREALEKVRNTTHQSTGYSDLSARRAAFRVADDALAALSSTSEGGGK